jgi:beta-lactamase superfamily II metal-dependent hydrolase
LAVVLAGAVDGALGLRVARLHVLPLNGVPAVFVSAPGLEGTFLIDCGSSQSARDLLKPFLCAQGVNRLAGLCLAVGRSDYAGGAALLLSNFPAAEIFTSTAQDRSTSFRSLIGELRQSHVCQAVRDPAQIDGWSVLHPGPSDQFPQADDNALVLWRQFNGHSVLLLPSLGRDGQDSLMRRHPGLCADFVIAGLPVRDEPLCEPLLETLRPRLIIIADATYPATRRAAPKLRERLARHGARVVYCRDNGALTLELAPDRWSLLTADGLPAVDSPPPLPDDPP